MRALTIPLEVSVRRKFLTLSLAAVIPIAAGLVTTAPAQAAPSPVTISCVSGQITALPSTVTASATEVIAVTNSAVGANPLNVSLNGATGSATIATAATQNYTVVNAAGGTLTISAGNGSCIGSSTVVTFAPGGGGGGGTPPAATPVTETLSLSVAASGATCTGGNPSGTSGSWLTLPGADQCSQSGPTAKPGAKLLGWSTSSNFPIARAQAQIDKKWGVIDEEIDGIRMIFIPGGMATFVSGSNNLFPIWSA